MVEASKFRVELCRCVSGSFHVTVQPLSFLCKEEFAKWMRVCKRNFMFLTSKKPWVFENVFREYNDALLFARRLCRLLGKVCFFDRTKGQFQIITPKEEVLPE